MSQWDTEITQAANIYGVDPRLLEAIARFETGNFTSSQWENKYNPGGLWGGGGYRSFDSPQAGFDAMARTLYNNYISKGLTTPGQIGPKYAPIGASNDPHGTNNQWINAVKRIYQKLAGSAGNLAQSGRNMLPFAGQGIIKGGPFAGWTRDAFRQWHNEPGPSQQGLPSYYGQDPAEGLHSTYPTEWYQDPDLGWVPHAQLANPQASNNPQSFFTKMNPYTFGGKIPPFIIPRMLWKGAGSLGNLFKKGLGGLMGGQGQGQGHGGPPAHPGGYFDPEYLRSLGYREGQGTGSLFPGVGMGGPGSYGVGGQGGSFFVSSGRGLPPVVGGGGYGNLGGGGFVNPSALGSGGGMTGLGWAGLMKALGSGGLKSASGGSGGSVRYG